jgi:RNA polymerase subunit RPABC4/transcription elongation factor Spt4
MTLDQDTINTILLFLITTTGAVVSAIWLGLILWTWRDMQLRSRDPLARIAASLMVAVLGIFGIIIYIMLRPPETLAEAYERSLEEEALLQNIEEKPICPGCGRPVKEAWQVCPYCHTKLKKPCVECGEMLDLPWNLCPYCATPQPMPQQHERQLSGRRARRRSAPQPPPQGAQASPPQVADDEVFEPVEYIEDDGY